MALKQVEPVEFTEAEFQSCRKDDDTDVVTIESRDNCIMFLLTEPEARALVEWLKRVCE